MPFATPGSGSGPALNALSSGAQPASPTRHGYASVSEISYPRYDSAGEPQQELTGASLRPRRLGLVVVLVVLGIGVIALVVALAGGGGDNSTAKGSDALVLGSATNDTGSSAPMPPPTVSPPMPTPVTGGSGAKVPVKQPVAPVTPTAPTHPVAPTPPTGGSAAGDDDGMVAVHVGSEPVTGAEVLLDGKRLGTTPLDIKIKRGSGMATLTVRSAKYGEATARVDTSGDFSKQMTLHKDEPKPPVHDTPHVQQQPTHPTTTTTTKPKCQQPGPNMDPFSGVPVCK